MTPPIESLYNENRFPSGVGLLLLLLYTPMGLVIFLLRVFISLQLFLAAYILPHNTLITRVVLRVLYLVLGVVVREEDKHKKDSSCRIIITNHITPFDHLAVSIVYPCVTPSLYALPSAVSWVLCYRDVGVTQGREVLRTNTRAYLSNTSHPPLLIHPEGATTSGNVALMKYGSWAFELSDSVLVAGVRVWRIPTLSVAPSVLGASWAADLCFTLFSPFTVYTVRYIGCMRRGDGEGVEEFSSRVQGVTASTLHLHTSQHTVADKVEYMKRLARDAAMASNPLLNPEVLRMAQQVQEVLPHVPLDHIKRDLVHTQNVDITITNFLESTVLEPVPEPIPSTPSSSTPTHPPPSSTTPRPSLTPLHPSTASPTQPVTSASKDLGSLGKLATPGDISGGSGGSGGSDIPQTPSPNPRTSPALTTAAPTFGKSAGERMASFEKRKAMLIENARRKYIEKHRLHIQGYNC